MAEESRNDLQNTLVELLSQFGTAREALTYLKRFSALPSHRFAIIKVGGGILNEDLSNLVAAIAFLRHMGLTPLLLHGAGPQLSAALRQAGIPSTRVNGMRVTTPEIITIVRRIMFDSSARILEAMEQQGVRTRALQNGIFECDILDQQSFGLVGRITHIHTASIEAATRAGAVPIITPLGELPSGQVLNINADYAAAKLATTLIPAKIVFLSPAGGLRDARGEVVPAINLATDYNYLMEQPWLEGGMRTKIKEIKELLDILPPSVSVSITASHSLSRELLTHEGAGTLVRRGELIQSNTHIPTDDEFNIRTTLEQSFKRVLHDNYFTSLKPLDILWSTSRRALAIITEGVDNIPYLDKFAVTPEGQGEGLGAALWTVIRERHPVLYWRSKVTNPINAWYLRQADAMVRANGWLVLSYGVHSVSALDACRHDALSRPESFIPRSQL